MASNLQHYLKKWKLANPKPLASTPTSTIYTVTYKNQLAVLKILTAVGRQDEQHGAIALQCFGGQGAIKLFKHDSQAHLLEFAAGETLTSLVQSGEDEKATHIIADTLNKLHYSYTGTPPKVLVTLNHRFAPLFNKAAKGKHQHNGLDSLFIRAAKIANTLLSKPNDIRVLHGDIHHDNIKYHTKRGWLAIDPKGLVGERTYDAANSLCNPWNMAHLVVNSERLLKNATLLAEELKIDRDRLLSFTIVHACLSVCWSLEEGGDPSHALKMARLVEPLLSV